MSWWVVASLQLSRDWLVGITQHSDLMKASLWLHKNILWNELLKARDASCSKDTTVDHPAREPSQKHNEYHSVFAVGPCGCESCDTGGPVWVSALCRGIRAAQLLDGSFQQEIDNEHYDENWEHYIYELKTQIMKQYFVIKLFCWWLKWILDWFMLNLFEQLKRIKQIFSN